jgi:hypothetical protein
MISRRQRFSPSLNQPWPIAGTETYRMNTQPTTDVALLGLDLLLGPDSLISELSPEDEAAISGGRRRRRSRSGISRPSRSFRRNRRRR